MQSDLDHCERLLRENDRDRFLAALFAPAERRGALHALYAFDLEVLSIGARVREPLAGEMRLQWWREVLEGARAEEAHGHPVAAALLHSAAQYGLPKQTLHTFLDAHAFDVYAEPMGSVAQFETYAAETGGAVIALAAQALGAVEGSDLASASAAAGRSSAYADALVRLPADVARGFTRIPAEVLERHGADSAALLAQRTTPALLAAANEMQAQGRYWLAEMHKALARLPSAVRPAFLHLSLLPPLFDRVQRRGYEPFGASLQSPAWRRQWRLWRASRTWLQ
jgi:15-cis-phytoene synthase